MRIFHHRSIVTAVLLATLFVPALAANFNVRQFGAAGDGKADDGPAIQRAVDAAIRSGRPGVVLIPAGTYLLGETKEKGQIQITHARSLKIVGSSGTLLISSSPQSNIFSILDSTDVHITRLKMDRRPLLFTQGVVTAVNLAQKTAHVRVDPTYSELDDPLIVPQKWFIVYSDPASGTWGDHSEACAFNKPGDPLACWPPSITSRRQTGPREWEVTLNTAPQENYVGHRVVIWWGFYKGRGFLIQRSRDVYVEDVTYYGGGADGFVVDHNRGKVSFQRFTIGVPPGSDRLLAVTGGGMVFNNHSDLVLDHVDISHGWDDSVNVGANFARIYRQPAQNKIEVDGSRGDFVVGDRLAIWDWKRKAEIAQPRITKMECDSKPMCELTLDTPLTIAHPGYAPVKSTGNDMDGIDRVIDLDGVGTFHVANSSFQSLHARCLLIKSSHSVVKDSLCHDTVMAGLLIGPQFYWDEGPEVHDLTISNNEFRNVSGANILVTNGGSANAPSIIDLKITGNTFVDYDRYEHGVDVRAGAAILLQSTSASTITGNRFSTRYKPQCCGMSVEQFASDFSIK